MMTLSELELGQQARIVGIATDCPSESHQRFLDLGFVRGVNIVIQNISPLRDPIAYNILNTLISLRIEDAKSIYIELID